MILYHSNFTVQLHGNNLKLQTSKDNRSSYKTKTLDDIKNLCVCPNKRNSTIT